MRQISRLIRLGMAAGLWLLVPTMAEAGDLKAPTIVASAAAAADWASTYHTLKNYRTREMNPLLRPLDHRPGTMVTVGAAIDVGLVTTWNMTVGRKNEKLAAIGLWSMAAFCSPRAAKASRS